MPDLKRLSFQEYLELKRYVIAKALLYVVNSENYSDLENFRILLDNAESVTGNTSHAEAVLLSECLNSYRSRLSIHIFEQPARLGATSFFIRANTALLHISEMDIIAELDPSVKLRCAKEGLLTFDADYIKTHALYMRDMTEILEGKHTEEGQLDLMDLRCARKDLIKAITNLAPEDEVETLKARVEGVARKIGIVNISAMIKEDVEKAHNLLIDSYKFLNPKKPAPAERPVVEAAISRQEAEAVMIT